MSDGTNAAVVGDIIGIVARLGSAYLAARELAAKSGISEADMDASVERFHRNYADPLAGQSGTIGDPPPPPPPSSGFEYYRILSYIPADDVLQEGDEVYVNAGQSYIQQRGVGTQIPAGFTLSHTVSKVAPS